MNRLLLPVLSLGLGLSACSTSGGRDCSAMMKDIDDIDTFMTMIDGSIEDVQRQDEGRQAIDHLISQGDDAIALFEGLMRHSKYYSYAASEFLRMAAPEKWSTCGEKRMAQIYYLRFYHDSAMEDWIQYSTVHEDYLLGSAGARLVKLGPAILRELKGALESDKLLTDCVGNAHAGIRRKDLAAALALMALGRPTKPLAGNASERDVVIAGLLKELPD